MKKIMIAVLAVLSFGVASAQLDVEISSSQSYAVYPMRAGVSLNYTRVKGEAEYYFRLNTSNQYAPSIYIWLGNRDKALKTLNQLLNELYAQGESYYLTDTIGESFTALCSNTMGAKGYMIHKSGHAGYAYIRLKQIEQMIELL